MNNVYRVLAKMPVTLSYALPLVAVSIILPGAASAQEWTITPRVLVTAEYNDNIRLQVNDAAQDEIRGGEIDARANIRRRSPTGEVLFAPRVRSSRYPGDTEDDSNDYFLLFSGEHISQKSIWSLETRYSEQQVLSSELEDPDFDDPDIGRPIADDTGLVQFKNRRARFSVAPGVEFQLSPRNNLEFLAEYGLSDYENNLGGLEDYSYGGVQMNLVRDLTERTALSVGVFGNTFDADQSNNTSDAYGLQLQLDREFSERNSGYIYAGVQHTTTDSTADDMTTVNSSDNTLIAGLGMTREYEVSRLVLDLRHSVDPTGQGALSERTRFRAKLSRRFSPLVTGIVSARVQTEDTVPQSDRRPERDFAQLQLGLTWQLNRNWSVLTAYTYTQQEFGNQSDKARSNAAKIGIQYAPPSRN